MKDCIEAFDLISKSYINIVQQLHSGYLSADAIIPANQNYTKLTKILARVGSIAEELADTKNFKRSVERRLANGIRIFAIRYYENKRILPTPPTVKKYLQKQRNRMINEKKRKLENNKYKKLHNFKVEDMQLDAFVSEVKPNSHHFQTQNSKHSFQSDETSSQVTDMDPIQQQIEYVRNLLAEAEKQGRTNEVDLLNKNLESLMNFLETNSNVASTVNTEVTQNTSSCVEIGELFQINF